MSTPEPQAASPATLRSPLSTAEDTGAARPSYSVVIPVFNSERIVGSTVERTISFFEGAGLDFEVILVDDGSSDGSWDVVRELAESNPAVVAIKLLKNYGQHNANLCGFRAARGDFVITMDDDGQNPPEEIAKLISAAEEGYEVVFGQFEQKQSSLGRALGSRAIGLVNRRIFGQPRDLAVSNFRILRRDVVERICASGSAHPYISGQALLYSTKRANVRVRHAPRVDGESNYNLVRITRLVLTIMFSYSSAPLHAMAVAGSIIAFGSFGVGAFYLLYGLLGQSQVEGWTSLIVLLTFLNGVVILMLGMLGEYTVRTLNQVSDKETFHVVARLDRRE
jgi:glycosyltransferase involved in cell wall biosynthesis